MTNQLCADCSTEIKDGEKCIKVASGKICVSCYNGYMKDLEISDNIIKKKERKGRKK